MVNGAHAEQSMHLCCQAERAAASGTAHTHTPSQQSSALRIGGLIRVALAMLKALHFARTLSRSESRRRRHADKPKCCGVELGEQRRGLERLRSAIPAPASCEVDVNTVM